MKTIYLEIELTLDEPVELESPSVSGHVLKNMDATDDADNEENAVRLAEQMVREAFRRWRDKN